MTPDPRLKFADGDWYQNPKARAQRLSLNSLSKEARQVYARIELATMGYGQEKAVVSQAGDKRRLLTTGDIARDTELNEANVRRAFRELEAQGLAERRAVDGGALRKGNVAIYSTPCPPSLPREKKGGRARPQNSSPLPDSWAILTAFARREKIRLPDEIEVARDLIERGEQVARDLENAQMRARAFLDEVSARSESGDSIRKKEIDRQQEKETTTTAVSLTSSAPVTSSAPEPPSEPERAAIHAVSPPTLAEHVRAWLQGKFPIPTALGPDIFSLIMASIPDHAVFEQFQEAVKDSQPRNWVYFVKIARSCFINRQTYATVKAAHNGTSETHHSKATQGALDLMRRRIMRGDKPL